MIDWLKGIEWPWKKEFVALCKHDFRRTGEYRWDFTQYGGLSKFHRLRCQRCKYLVWTQNETAEIIPLEQKENEQ